MSYCRNEVSVQSSRIKNTHSKSIPEHEWLEQRAPGPLMGSHRNVGTGRRSLTLVSGTSGDSINTGRENALRRITKTRGTCDANHRILFRETAWRQIREQRWALGMGWLSNLGSGGPVMWGSAVSSIVSASKLGVGGRVIEVGCSGS